MKNLKQLRERAGVTQAELARRVGTTQQTIARWEAGKAEPNLTALRDLAICLGTTVDGLVGRASVIERQTTNPFAMYSGDKTGYWGNIGVSLPHTAHSCWYPVTTAVMERLFSILQTAKAGDWISFPALNNRMVVCRPTRVRAFTFLDEAEDEVEDDWEVGPADVEGWPAELYECLEHLMHEGRSVRADDRFSADLIRLANELVDRHDLDDPKLSEICVETRVMHSDGAVSHLHCSPERLAEAMFHIDLGLDAGEAAMLHLDDMHGDHSVFTSFDLVSLMEFPLTLLKRGLEAMEAEP